MDYVGNTDKSKEVSKKTDEKQIEKVVTGEVIQKKIGIGRKFKNIFLGGDFKNAMRYVGAEVLLPALRNLLYDSLAKGGERIIYGDSSYRRGRRPDLSGRVSYNNPIYRPRDPREVTHLPDQSPYRQQGYRTRRRDEEIILATRVDAERVVETLIDVIDKYEVASLADLNSMLGLPTSHIDNKWGWSSIKGTEIRQTRDGYLVELPPLEEI